MEIKYSITNYFEKNNLFKDNRSDGIIIKNENNIITIDGSQRDLIELADIIVNLAISKENKNHIHIDDLTLISTKSEIKEIIIEKE